MAQVREIKKRRIETRISTARKPYHYVGAGLPNVWLVGVEYRVDRDTGEQSADIPCLPALHNALVVPVICKESPLTGDELRFLRKRLGKSSKDFAALMGVSSEQYSRIENGAVLTPQNDKLIRLMVVGLALIGWLKSLFSPELMAKVAERTWTAEMNHEEKIIATQDENHQWVISTKAA